MTAPQTDKLIRRSIRRLEHMKEKPGPKMTEAIFCTVSLMFGATELESKAKHIAINIQQFLTSLADNLRVSGVSATTALQRTLVTKKDDTRSWQRCCYISQYWTTPSGLQSWILTTVRIRFVNCVIVFGYLMVLCMIRTATTRTLLASTLHWN